MWKLMEFDEVNERIKGDLSLKKQIKTRIKDN